MSVAKAAPQVRESRDESETAFRLALKDAGLRVTPNRLRMFRLLSQHREPLSCTELAGMMADEGMNAATVYRMMQQFTDAGIVHPVMVGHDHIGYELISPYRTHHDHFFCLKCGRTFDLAECGLDDAVVQLAERQGFQVTFHHAELHGLCPDCRAEAERQHAAGPDQASRRPPS